jgi:hypothetical protein
VRARPAAGDAEARERVEDAAVVERQVGQLDPWRIWIIAAT